MEYLEQLRNFGNGLAEQIAALLRDNGDLANLLAGNVFDAVLDWICTYFNIERDDVIPTFLKVLFMSIEDPENQDMQYVSDLFYKSLFHYDDWERVLIAVAVMLAPSGNPRRNQLQGGIKVSPTDLTGLRTVMQTAATNRQKIKAVSTNYSGLWTDIGRTTGLIIDTSRLTEKLVLDNECLMNEDNDQMYHEFEAGIKMNDIQLKLWPLEHRATANPENYRVLENVTSGAGLSLAGTVSTGAHGNGLNLGNVAEAVVSFQMFTIDSEWRVKRYQIEKTEPFTNPDEFRRKYPCNANNDYFELIQDDEVFNATVVNIGCMGVAYSYVLRTSKGFCLEETRTLHKWSQAKNKIRQLYVDPSIYNFQIIGSPYAYKLNSRETAEHHVLISVLKKVCGAGGIREKGKHSISPPIEMLDKALVAAGDYLPHVVPIVMHFSLLYLKHDAIVLNAVDALNTLAGIVETEFSGVRTSECAMRSSGAETVIEIMEDLHELYSDIRRSNDRQLVNVPIALRFTSKSSNYMAMEYDCHRPTITIEQSIINGTLGADDTLRKFRKRMLEKFEGRPHWGLLHEMDAEKLKRLYDANCRQKFISKLEQFDPKRVFENEFADWVFGRERRQLNNE